MKISLLILGTLLLSVFSSSTSGQGRILIYNPQAPTRLWSADGPLAGSGIWGQMLAGPTADGLLPVGAPVEHGPLGNIFGGVIEVPTVPCNTVGYAQMVVWDGRLWGTSFDSVPSNQLGATDVVSLFMNCFPLPTGAPQFTQPAIVPVPEPCALVLLVLGGCLVGRRALLRQRPASGN